MTKYIMLIITTLFLLTVLVLVGSYIPILSQTLPILATIGYGIVYLILVAASVRAIQLSIELIRIQNRIDAIDREIDELTRKMLEAK